MLGMHLFGSRIEQVANKGLLIQSIINQPITHTQCCLSPCQYSYIRSFSIKFMMHPSLLLLKVVSYCLIQLNPLNDQQLDYYRRSVALPPAQSNCVMISGKRYHKCGSQIQNAAGTVKLEFLLQLPQAYLQIFINTNQPHPAVPIYSFPPNLHLPLAQEGVQGFIAELLVVEGWGVGSIEQVCLDFLLLLGWTAHIRHALNLIKAALLYGNQESLLVFAAFQECPQILDSIGLLLQFFPEAGQRLIGYHFINLVESELLDELVAVFEFGYAFDEHAKPDVLLYAAIEWVVVGTEREKPIHSYQVSFKLMVKAAVVMMGVWNREHLLYLFRLHFQKQIEHADQLLVSVGVKSVLDLWVVFDVDWSRKMERKKCCLFTRHYVYEMHVLPTLEQRSNLKLLTLIHRLFQFQFRLLFGFGRLCSDFGCLQCRENSWLLRVWL